ncbi:MAG: hypothetical protein GY845_02570 [Planctomycetes bacterium]|nr:hypothetical protein [Planctomycetota bacterium]
MCKAKACALWTLLVVITATQNVSGLTRYDSVDVPKDIPDNVTVYSELEISEVGSIGDLDVILDISHRWDADLDVYLVAPDDTQVELFTDVGGKENNFYGTVLDDEASLSIHDGNAPFIGRYRPEGNLSILYGKDRHGTWKLKVTDDSALLSGTLNSWALVLDSSATPDGTAPPEPNDPNPADGAVDVSVETLLSWGPVDANDTTFRLLATTASEGIEPFSLIELETDPVGTGRLGDSCGAFPIDFSPEGELYGAGFDLSKFTMSDSGISCETKGSFHNETEESILMTGLTFHPDGTLYGVDFDLGTLDSVIYTIDKNTASSTERLRIPIWDGVIWAIDFSADGTLYSAFNELMVVDLETGQMSIISDANASDIDSAPDGFIYVTIDDTDFMQKIEPATGSLLGEYGPYGTHLWGIASQDLGQSSNSTEILSYNPSTQLFEDQMNSGASIMSMIAENPDVRAAIHARRELKAKLRALLDSSEGHRMMKQTNGGTPSVKLTSAARPGQALSNTTLSSGGITYDVYLDTVNPPTTLVCSDTLVQECDPGDLEHCTTYYWQVVASNSGGQTTPGPIWSFSTETVPADLDGDCDVDFDDLMIFMEYWRFGLE